MFPDASVAEHVTVVVPFGNEVPDDGLQSTNGLTGGQLSVAGGVANVTIAEQRPVSLLTVTLAGQGPTTGGPRHREGLMRAARAKRVVIHPLHLCVSAVVLSSDGPHAQRA